VAGLADDVVKPIGFRLTTRETIPVLVSRRLSFWHLLLGHKRLNCQTSNRGGRNAKWRDRDGARPGRRPRPALYDFDKGDGYLNQYDQATTTTSCAGMGGDGLRCCHLT
jgi:hypothetical protein